MPTPRIWSEIFVTGGRLVNITLPQPFTKLGYYREAFVLAFPSLAGESRSMQDLLSRVTSSSGPVDAKPLTDNDLSVPVEVRPAGSGQPAYLRLEFAEPFEARSIAVYVLPFGGVGFGGGRRGFGGASAMTLHASDDGVQFRKVSDISAGSAGGRGPDVPGTANFPAIRAKYFRLLSTQAVRITELRLSGAARIAGEVWGDLNGMTVTERASARPIKAMAPATSTDT